MMDEMQPSLSYELGTKDEAWKESVREKLTELLGDMPEKVDLNIRIQHVYETEKYIEKRIVFTAEKYADVPCYLLLPKNRQGKIPAVICLQGHTMGMHISLNRAIYPGDEKYTADSCRAFAIQAVEQGYAALALEQRCFGERRDLRPKPEMYEFDRGCHTPSLVALMLGRTMVGERVWDVSRAIDMLETLPEIDSDRIACMGTSGGGTITWFSACLEPRIKAAMPSCYVCSLKESIGRIDHCECNYIPGILKYFDIGDLACLIAPRPLVVVAGREDRLFPYRGVQKAFSTISAIYKDMGAEKNCRLVTGDAGHRFYPEQAWPVFNEISSLK